jgi:hypothetical protein
LRVVVAVDINKAVAVEQADIFLEQIYLLHKYFLVVQSAAEVLLL